MANYKLIKHGQYSWYHFDKCLSKDDHQFLSDKFSFSQDDLNSCKLKKSPRPKINITKSYTSLIFHIPYRTSKSSNLTICELNVFLTKTVLVTIESHGNLQALNNYLDATKNSSRLKESRFAQGTPRLFSKLMTQILTDLENLINQQGTVIDRLQQELFEKRLAKKFVETISIIRYNNIVAHNSLERQVRIFDSYSGEKNPLLNLDKNHTADWNKVMEAFHTVFYEIESDMDHLEGLVTTFESLVTFRTNEIIKLLTVFSVILLPLTLVSGIFGMNFNFIPLAGHQFGFFLTVMWMVIIGTIMAIVFKLKRWL